MVLVEEEVVCDAELIEEAPAAALLVPAPAWTVSLHSSSKGMAAPVEYSIGREEPIACISGGRIY